MTVERDLALRTLCFAVPDMLVAFSVLQAWVPGHRTTGLPPLDF